MSILSHEVVSILPHEAILPMRQNKIYGFAWADQDWIGLMIFKNLRIRSGSDSTSADQDWTRTEKFHSPLIFAHYHLVSSHKTYQNQGICYVTIACCYLTKTYVALNKFPRVKVARNTKKVGQAWFRLITVAGIWL